MRNHIRMYSTRTFGIALAVLLLGIAPSAAAFLHPAYIVPDACRAAQAATECTICHIGVLVINLTKILMIAIAIPAAALLVAIGGIVILTAGGSETRVTKGKEILKHTIIGIVIVFLAWLAVDTTIRVLTSGGDRFRGLENFGPWNELPVSRCGIK